MSAGLVSFAAQAAAPPLPWIQRCPTGKACIAPLQHVAVVHPTGFNPCPCSDKPAPAIESGAAAYIDRHNWSVHSGSAHPGAGSVDSSVHR